jgi:hypothetical protein
MKAPRPFAALAWPSAAALAVPFGQLANDLRDHIDRLEPDAGLSAEYDAVRQKHGIDELRVPSLRADFVRARILFEATRDGGLFRLKWAVTDQEPGSRRIWETWRRKTAFFGPPTAIAECDEISGLYAFLAKRAGVRAVGLFYPTVNHTIAAWEPLGLGKPDPRHRILIPTTQIFLSCDAGFDTTTFDPRAQRVWEYPLHDVNDNTAISDELAGFLLGQIDAYGASSPDLLALLRLDRAVRFGSSTGPCTQTRLSLVEALRTRDLSTADRAALEHYAHHEMAADLHPEKVLDALSR